MIVGVEVTRLILRKQKLETPYVISYKTRGQKIKTA